MGICQCVINGFVLIDLHVSHYADTPHTYLDTIIYMPFLTSYINICSSTVFYQQDWAINSKWWYGGSQGLIWLSQKSWWRFTDSIIKFNTTNITTTTTLYSIFAVLCIVDRYLLCYSFSTIHWCYLTFFVAIQCQAMCVLTWHGSALLCCYPESRNLFWLCWCSQFQ